MIKKYNFMLLFDYKRDCDMGNCCTTICCILHRSSIEKTAAANLKKSILRSTKINILEVKNECCIFVVFGMQQKDTL